MTVHESVAICDTTCQRIDIADQVEPHHKEASKQIIGKDGWDVQSICSTLGTNISNPFIAAEDSDQLWNIDIGMALPEESA